MHCEKILIFRIQHRLKGEFEEDTYSLSGEILMENAQKMQKRIWAQ